MDVHDGMRRGGRYGAGGGRVGLDDVREFCVVLSLLSMIVVPKRFFSNRWLYEFLIASFEYSILTHIS